MSRFTFRKGAFALLLTLFYALPASAQEATDTPEPLPAPPAGIDHVIVISLDGARPDAILQANTPIIQRLATDGAVDWGAQTVELSVTLPAHASMLTGLSIAEHGVDHNDNLYPCPPIAAPTFLTTAAEHDLTAAMVVGKEAFCIFRQNNAVDFTLGRAGDRSIVDRVIELLDSGTQVIFANFPNPDYFGHLEGWMSDTYISELHFTDLQVGRIIDALANLNLLDHTLVIITADHGGHDMEHGSTRPEDATIPWIAYGAGVIPGTELSGISVADTAATVLWALGLPIPVSEASRPVTEAFAEVAN